MMTIFPWKRQKKNELQKIFLGKRGDTYYISLKPAQPIRRSDICALENVECSYFADPVVHQTPKPKSEESEFELSDFWITYRPFIRPSQTRIENKAYTVSLYKNASFLKAEVENHVKVYLAVHALWPRVKRAVDRKLPRIGVPKPAAKILTQGRTSFTNVPVGFMTRTIPALSLQHCRSLVNACLDPRIRKRVRDDPLISEVRFRVRMGEMSPPNEHLNTQLLFRPVYFNQLRFEAGKHAVLRWATSMGLILAILHWSCGLDGEGVNFVLGCYHRNVRPCFWVTDFGDCKPIKLGRWRSRQWLSAIMDNPTWPRPAFAPNFIPDGDPDGGMGIEEAWDLFVGSYKAASRAVILKQNRRAEIETPRRFIRKLESAWKRRQAAAMRACLTQATNGGSG